MKKLILGLFAVAGIGSAVAQTSVAPAQDSQSQFASLLASNISQLLANTDSLKKQIETLQADNAKLKDEIAKFNHPAPPPPSAKSQP